ncbi:MAG: acylphosphatase [Anaerolineae bacterium]|nr:MAG: acylphosphatase [Anaerolineae bacterium]
MKRESNRVTAAIKGRVQGVSFRYYTLHEADRLGLKGWVRNERDGSVTAVAEGNPAQLEEFIRFLRRGSPAARVSSIDVEWLESTGEYERFDIRWA